VLTENFFEVRIKFVGDNAQPRPDGALANFFVRLVAFYELCAKKRHHGHGDEIRCEEGKNHSKRQRHEEKTADAVKKHHGEEDNRSGHRGRQHRQPDLLAAILGGHLRGFAEFEMTKDVFEDDDGVVDQAGKREREPSENHGVDSAATSSESQKGGQRRKRNGKKNGGGSPEASEKEQNHYTGEDQADSAFADQVEDGSLDENRLVENYSCRKLLRDVNEMLEGIGDAIDHGDGVRVAALFENRQVDRGLAIHAHDVGLNSLGVHGLADVAHQHRGLANGFERHAVNGRCRRRLAIGVEVVLERHDLHVTGRQDQVGLVDLAHYVHGAQLVCIKLKGIDVHHDLAVSATEGLRHGSTGNIGNLIPDGVLTQIVKLSFVEAFS